VYGGEVTDDGLDSAEFCSMATPNGMECQREFKFNGTSGVFSMIEQDNRHFNVSCIIGGSVTSKGLVSVRDSDGKVSFSECSECSADTSTCRELLSLDEGGNSGTELSSVDGYECTEFAEKLFYYLIDKGFVKDYSKFETYAGAEDVTATSDGGSNSDANSDTSDNKEVASTADSESTTEKGTGSNSQTDSTPQVSVSNSAMEAGASGASRILMSVSAWAILFVVGTVFVAS